MGVTRLITLADPAFLNSPIGLAANASRVIVVDLGLAWNSYSLAVLQFTLNIANVCRSYSSATPDAFIVIGVDMNLGQAFQTVLTFATGSNGANITSDYMFRPHNRYFKTTITNNDLTIAVDATSAMNVVLYPYS